MSRSFEQWVTTSQRALLSYAHLLTGDREEARDVVQEVYSRLASKFDRVDGIDAYARRSITNEVASRRRRPRLATVPLDREHATPDGAVAVPDKVLAWRLCAELPTTQRAAVVLRFFEDLSFAEIGDILQMPEATARSHVHRALTALRGRLDKEDIA